jgi:hypothetical protein
MNFKRYKIATKWEWIACVDTFQRCDVSILLIMVPIGNSP